MDEEKQICSLELARELKRLGVRQDALSFWAERPDGEIELVADDYVKHYSIEEKVPMDNIYAAFTVAEFGEMLPDEIYRKHDDKIFGLTIEKYNYGWCIGYSDDNYGLWSLETEEKTEADARAKMLIKIIEKGYITNADWLERSA